MIIDLSVAAPQPTGEEGDDFALDVTVVETGPGRLALLADTDDNCDTKKNGDC
jgi:FxLD family lantipeptide